MELILQLGDYPLEHDTSRYIPWRHHKHWSWCWIFQLDLQSPHLMLSQTMKVTMLTITSTSSWLLSPHLLIQDLHHVLWCPCSQAHDLLGFDSWVSISSQIQQLPPASILSLPPINYQLRFKHVPWHLGLHNTLVWGSTKVSNYLHLVSVRRYESALWSMVKSSDLSLNWWSYFCL